MICKSLGNSLSKRVDCQEVERKHTKNEPNGRINYYHLSHVPIIKESHT